MSGMSRLAGARPLDGGVSSTSGVARDVAEGCHMADRGTIGRGAGYFDCYFSLYVPFWWLQF